MKIRLITFFLLIVSSAVSGQDCSNFSSLQQGTKYEMTSYNEKDKKIGKNRVEVKGVNAEAGKKTFDLKLTTLDEKEKEKHSGDFQIICDGEKIKIDMSEMIKQAGAGMQQENMEMVVEEFFLEMPSDLSPGQTLDDATIIMKIIDKTTGQQMMEMNMKISNRKVVAKESLTTPAGTYEVFKISYDMTGTMKMMGKEMPLGSGTKTVEYFSKEVGTVKTETYQNEKLQSYSVMTSYSKG